MLDLCVGPTLDVGCGPGRMTQLLAERGDIVLGIDVVPEAIWQTRDRGVAAILRDVFEDVPAEGRWQTCCSPMATSASAATPCGCCAGSRSCSAPVAASSPTSRRPAPDCTRGRATNSRRPTSEPFPWSVVGADAIGELVAAGALHGETLDVGDRWVGALHESAA